MDTDLDDPRLQPTAYIHNARPGQKGRLAEVLARVPGKVTIEYSDTLEVVPVAPWQVTRDWTLVRAAPHFSSDKRATAQSTSAPANRP